ncbi:MAG: tRNA uridine-5-carboxymethylaminomethyl(34) synthesis GTPase MnmE [Campylobacterales bacterium]
MDTIAAIGTPNGIGAISVVRLSGPEAYPIAQKLLKRKELKPRYAHLRKIYDLKGELIDIGLVLYFKAPHSFTGEDLVEFQCHGGVGVTRAILEELLKGGARLARPGEFTKRAFLNQKIDLTQAEAIGRLIESRSIEGAKLLSRHLAGELKEFLERVRGELLELMAYAEVSIDYAEEDLPKDLEEQLVQKAEKVAEELEELLEQSLRRQGAISGYKVAIVGKPNVGKSSILNRLLNRERAIVSEIAGTTRDTIEEDLLIGTHLVRIVDTAGIREAKDQIERIGVERSRKAIEEADLVVPVISAEGLTSEDWEILELVKKGGKEGILVVNKIDLNPTFTPPPELEKVGCPILKLSAKESIRSLVQKLEELLDKREGDQSLVLVSTRQIEAVRRGAEAVRKGIPLLKKGELELFSYQIQEGIRNISEITRPFQFDEMLEKLFSNFCVGK